MQSTANKIWPREQTSINKLVHVCKDTLESQSHVDVQLLLLQEQQKDLKCPGESDEQQSGWEFVPTQIALKFLRYFRNLAAED